MLAPHGGLDEAATVLCSVAPTSHTQCQAFFAGIGKTLFAVYMLYRLALEGHRVVYHKHQQEPKLFCADGSLPTGSTSFRRT